MKWRKRNVDCTSYRWIRSPTDRQKTLLRIYFLKHTMCSSQWEPIVPTVTKKWRRDSCFVQATLKKILATSSRAACGILEKLQEVCKMLSTMKQMKWSGSSRLEILPRPIFGGFKIIFQKFGKENTASPAFLLVRYISAGFSTWKLPSINFGLVFITK